jgi:hypothetical protein
MRTPLLGKRIRRKMYAVSQARVGIIAGTMAYSRRQAIAHFLDGGTVIGWEGYKRSGYRTVQVKIVVTRDQRGET